jgi:hypothetical protein
MGAADQGMAAHGAICRLPLVPPILLVGWDVSHPSTYIKGPLEESLTQVDWESSYKSSPLLSPMRHLSSSFPLVHLPYLESCQQVRVFSSYRTSWGYRTSSPNISFSAALLDWIRKESWCAIRVRVLWGTARATLCRCAGAVALASWRWYVEFFTTLRSATSASSSTHMRGRNPRDRSMRVHVRVFVNRYNITR